MKVVIAGTRTFKNYKLLRSKCDAILKNVTTPIEVVCGTPIEEDRPIEGADMLGEMYARERGYTVKYFPVTKAEWNKLGKAAGPMRNKKMADYGEALIAFHDGKSPGTTSMINLARAKGIPVRVIRY